MKRIRAEGNKALFPLSLDIFSRERERIAKGWGRIGEIDAMLAPVPFSLGGIPFSLHRYTSVGISSIVAHFQEEYVPLV
jgi:hypothetical protein